MNKIIVELKNKVENSKIEELTVSDSIIKVKSIVDGNLCWHIFYDNYIVCTGDLEDWAFKLNYNVISNQKVKINSSIEELLNNLSNNNNKYIYIPVKAMLDIETWYDSWKNKYHYLYNDLEEDEKEELKNLIEDFTLCVENEDRLSAKVDEFIEDFVQLTTYSFENDYELYNIGKEYNINLLMNICIIDKIINFFKES